MTPKTYNSFEEIDMHLKILKLKRTIDIEHLSYNYNRVRRYLYPTNILMEIGNLLKEKLVYLIYERYGWIF
ncbi:MULTISPECIES: DUF6327 family protein [Flavobacteriaceae]|uniref:Uncharacterized protein n=2 Tax=Flavobacteriaceae TaxID=49546 RepID=A0A4Y8AYF5_9FLAO|nr:MULTISPECIES: DUF6327 family protein [Flavobacteriaceae]TEW77045.1 hypothetical protein E2488_04140 [Gramella jeungdoensis]GGK58431.1 hypothetical protein GCM10007963_28210 [Lutibacter litoralis]